MPRVLGVKGGLKAKIIELYPELVTIKDNDTIKVYFGLNDRWV